MWCIGQRGGRSGEKSNAVEAAIGLSAGTRSVLQQVKSPVEIRFYCLLDEPSASAALKSFAGRVDKMLSAYERQANGKIKVTRINAPSTENDNAALAAGIRPLDLDKGEGS